jgi:hypothetical protein
VAHQNQAFVTFDKLPGKIDTGLIFSGVSFLQVARWKYHLRRRNLQMIVASVLKVIDSEGNFMLVGIAEFPYTIDVACIDLAGWETEEISII